MRKIDADEIKFENRNGEMVVTKEAIDAMTEIVDATPMLTKLEIMGFKTKCHVCGFEKFFEGTTIGEYAYCEKCGCRIITQEENDDVDQDAVREDNT